MRVFPRRRRIRSIGLWEKKRGKLAAGRRRGIKLPKKLLLGALLLYSSELEHGGVPGRSGFKLCDRTSNFSGSTSDSQGFSQGLFEFGLRIIFILKSECQRIAAD